MTEQVERAEELTRFGLLCAGVMLLGLLTLRNHPRMALEAAVIFQVLAIWSFAVGVYLLSEVAKVGYRVAAQLRTKWATNTAGDGR